MVYSAPVPTLPLKNVKLGNKSKITILKLLLFSHSVVSNSLQLHGHQALRHQASLSIANSQSLLKLMSIKSAMPSNHLIFSRPLLLPSVLPSIRVFSNESALRIRRPKYWSVSFSISPSSEYSGVISFRTDWLDLLAGESIFVGSSYPESPPRAPKALFNKTKGGENECNLIVTWIPSPPSNFLQVG